MIPFTTFSEWNRTPGNDLYAECGLLPRLSTVTATSSLMKGGGGGVGSDVEVDHNLDGNIEGCVTGGTVAGRLENDDSQPNEKSRGFEVVTIMTGVLG
jgi:hypothetical protein